MDDEIVVLVNDKNQVLGTAPKLATHNAHTPLHRGFSVFIFNSHGELLLQERSLEKKTWPGVWSNSCCGHPMLDETSVLAAKRRLKFELGLVGCELFEILPDYRYRTEKDGIVEHEICPVLIGFTDQTPQVNHQEVKSISWILWSAFMKKIEKDPGTYSSWAEEEARILERTDRFQVLFKEFVKISQ